LHLVPETVKEGFRHRLPTFMPSKCTTTSNWNRSLFGTPLLKILKLLQHSSVSYILLSATAPVNVKFLTYCTRCQYICCSRCGNTSYISWIGTKGVAESRSYIYCCIGNTTSCLNNCWLVAILHAVCDTSCPLGGVTTIFKWLIQNQKA
jgi:hypothetical protein